MAKTVQFEITGAAPLLMHSDKFADPLRPETIRHKELTGKTRKTEEDHRAVARSEWLGGLYLDDDLGIYMPTANVRRTLIDGGKLHRLGKKIERAVIFMESRGFALTHEGGDDLEAMFNDGRGKFVDCRSVMVQRSKLMRYRPRFDKWSFKGELMLDEAQLSYADLRLAFDSAGLYAGLGDYRPTHGRFSVTVH